MTQTTIPSGDNSLLASTQMRQAGRLERILGPENYRIITGMFKTPASIVGFSLIVLFILVAVFAPFLAPPRAVGDPFQIPRDGFSADPKPPGAEWNRNAPPVVPGWYKALTGNEEWVHLMGTSAGQYDIFYGIVWGTRTAFKTGLVVVFVTLIIGVVVGSVAAYYGGAVDNIIMRIVDIFLILPFILAALILAAVLTPRIGKSLIPTMTALIAFGWMGYARIVRSDILTVKERDYVMAARVIGVKNYRILFRHILPNAIFPTMVLASLAIGDVVLSFAALSFLGVGTEIGYADWGQILSFARNYITSLDTYWYILIYPGVALVLFVLGWNLLGDALRDVLDPRMRGKV